MNLMPQLPTPFADLLARQLSVFTVTECRHRRSLDHMNRVFSPTGGTRISDENYTRLCNDLSVVAEQAGYPKDNAAAHSQFDCEAAIFLHKEFKITENEAAKPGVWNFLSCVALPDIVRWRWMTNEATGIERFLSGHRNTFERLWWRAKAYYDVNAQDPYWLIREIGEDESVGMMERTALSGMRPFVVAVLRGLIECYKTKPPIARSELMRDAMKRFRRIGGVVALENLSESELADLCRSVFQESVVAANQEHRSGDRAPAISSKAMAPSPKKSTNVNKPGSAGVPLQDLAWLESEMKRNQGKREKR